ncbi:hypothetical protein [Pedobacter sp. WC2423]|uniref:hypothetical protein n=1 Tax=Pedobacter sp. WC2423 TaxID=3234142 RepID=UPI00346533F5
MKNPMLICLALVSTILYSCRQDNGKNPEKPIATTCYMAVDGRDTAKMELQSFSKGRVSGNLVVNYYKKDNNHGEFEGAFKGDTLFVIYSFKIGKNSTGYKNPLAFLKKEDKLIMGIGKMEGVLGRIYFRKDIPIDFTQGRFTYAPVNCKKEPK